VDLTPDQAAIAVERNDCPKCEAPVGSPCHTRGGKTATKYHTARFILVPALREELDVLVPEDRGPGRPWKPGPPVEAAPAAAAAKPIRIGYARCSTAQQELQSQLDALEPVYKRTFSEKISTRVKTRPELEKALKLAYDIKEAAPDKEVILTVHELKRLARNAAELMTLSNQLQTAGVQLELLTGPLTGWRRRGGHRSRRCAACGRHTRRQHGADQSEDGEGGLDGVRGVVDEAVDNQAVDQPARGDGAENGERGDDPHSHHGRGMPSARRAAVVIPPRLACHSFTMGALRVRQTAETTVRRCISPVRVVGRRREAADRRTVPQPGRQPSIEVPLLGNSLLWALSL
jgi:hypothetical protein